MRILLVTGDDDYADEFHRVAEAAGVGVELIGPEDDLEGAVKSHNPNAVVFDAHRTVARAARLANIFASLHPRVMIVLVAERAREQTSGNLRVFDKWRSAERLVGDLQRAHLGNVPSAQSNSVSRE